MARAIGIYICEKCFDGDNVGYVVCVFSQLCGPAVFFKIDA